MSEQKLLPRPEGLDRPYAKTIIKAMSRVNIALYRLTGGFLGGTWRVMAGWKKPVEICLLTTIGRKTGEPRVSPLLFTRDGDRVIVVASQGGLPSDPLWYRNLQAHPEVTIQIRRDVRKYRARTATPEERPRLWKLCVETYADYETYASWTDRQIPVVVCEPVG